VYLLGVAVEGDQHTDLQARPLAVAY